MEIRNNAFGRKRLEAFKRLSLRAESECGVRIIQLTNVVWEKNIWNEEWSVTKFGGIDFPMLPQPR